MGSRLIQQRRGRGGTVFRAPPRKFRPDLRFRNVPGRVVDIIPDRARDAPLAEIMYSNNSRGHIVAVQGLKVGDSTESLVVPISQLSEGTQVSSIETYPNSGPKLCRTPGSFATLVAKTQSWCTIQLPSKFKKRLNPKCRVVVGVPAGEGRREKPLLKAGKKAAMMKARGKLYPRVSGKAMNANEHPYGGGYGGGVGTSKSTPRNAPPGRKVGSLAPRRTGKRK